MLMIRPAREEDIRALAPRMRSIDKLECAMFGRMGPLEAIKSSITDSLWSKTAIVDGDIQCLFGVSPAGHLLGDVGRPWMLAAHGIEKHARHLLRYSRGYVEGMQDAFPRLENFVHGENRTAIRWLKWCGFSFEDWDSYDDEPVKRFWKEAA